MVALAMLIKFTESAHCAIQTWSSAGRGTVPCSSFLAWVSRSAKHLSGFQLPSKEWKSMPSHVPEYTYFLMSFHCYSSLTVSSLRSSSVRITHHFYDLPSPLDRTLRFTRTPIRDASEDATKILTSSSTSDGFKRVDLIQTPLNQIAIKDRLKDLLLSQDLLRLDLKDTTILDLQTVLMMILLAHLCLHLLVWLYRHHKDPHRRIPAIDPLGMVHHLLMGMSSLLFI